MFILPLRSPLVAWAMGIPQENYYSDIENLSMNVGKKIVLQVKAGEAGLEAEWKDPTWQGWGDLLNATEFKELIDKANERLTKSSKGEGKGKKGGASKH